MTTEVLKKLDLSQGSFSQNLLAEYIGDFLDGNTFAGLDVGRRAGEGARESVSSWEPIYMRGMPTLVPTLV